MAVKQSYGIKTPMLSTAFDTEITLQKDGVGLRPLPIKFVIITVISSVLCMKCATSELVSIGNMVQKSVFVCMWLAMTVLLFMSDKTKRMNFQNIISLLNYIAVPTNRRVVTRRDVPATAMLDMCNIKGIDKSGVIKFADRHFGYMYRVTGTASVLLFDEDKKQIINAVDNFYRKIDANTEFIFMTLKEPQKIYNQAAAVKYRYNKLKLNDNDLNDLCNNQLVMLREVVGKQYQSIHQYMIIKADSMESLLAAKITIQAELDSSGLFIKRCIPLYDDEILDALATVYSTSKYNDNIEIMSRNKAKQKQAEEVSDVMERNNDGQKDGDTE